MGGLGVVGIHKATRLYRTRLPLLEEKRRTVLEETHRARAHVCVCVCVCVGGGVTTRCTQRIGTCRAVR